MQLEEEVDVEVEGWKDIIPISWKTLALRIVGISVYIYVDNYVHADIYVDVYVYVDGEFYFTSISLSD